MEPIRILYLAPWVDLGGSDKGTIDWFKTLDRSRFDASLITTQPSQNRSVHQVVPYANEVWDLPSFMLGNEMPGFILEFIVTRNIDVIHIMNSRLGFELIPDIKALNRVPKVVVQMHCEENDRACYVQMVTRRYGELVDSYSLTSESLAERAKVYGVIKSRINVITTGVDAEDEFNPDYDCESKLVDDRYFNVLFAGRIVDQKDPLLMVEVVSAVAKQSSGIRFNVIGEGHLEDRMRLLLMDSDLDEFVCFFPPVSSLRSWYKQSDALLLTSVFEGIPYVCFEALAMELPIVAPALPGIVELLKGTGCKLVNPRDNVEAYASTLIEWAQNQAICRKLGVSLRRHALEEHSLQDMANKHAELYERLVT